MKRYFSIALILALLGLTAVFPVNAEELEIIGEDMTVPPEEFDPAGSIDIQEVMLEGEEAPQQTLSEDIEAFSPDEGAVRNAPIGTSADAAVDDAATSIALNKEVVRIGVGEEYQGLVVTPLPTGSKLPAITWRSGNRKIAKVSNTGVITGVKKGTCFVYAKIAGSKTSVKCKVRVRRAPEEVLVDPVSLVLSPGMTSQLRASVPDGYCCNTYFYKSGKEQVATVDDNGLVTARKHGTAVVTVKTYNGKKARVKVVVRRTPATVVFSSSTKSIAIGHRSTLKATALSAIGKTTPAVITYTIDPSSPDPGCITLDPKTGKIKGVRRGRAVICGTAHNGAVGYCEVEVDVAPAGISLNYASISIGVSEVYADLLPTLTPPKGEKSCVQRVTWTSNNKKIARVDPATGIITGISSGSCTIKAKVPGGLYATCSVNVLKAPGNDSISISPRNGSLRVGQSGQYKITFSRGYGGSLSYASSNTEVATISNTGIVTAISPGTAVITVTTYNGIQKSANLEVISANPGDSGPDGSKSGNDEKIQYVIKLAMQKLDMPYIYGSGYGESNPRGFDCSGLVYWCYKQIGIKLQDSSYKQGHDDRYDKISYEDLKPGDVVCFDTSDTGKKNINHTGIYLGNGNFIHSSSSARKVVISAFVTRSTDFYKRNFVWGRRILK